MAYNMYHSVNRVIPITDIYSDVKETHTLWQKFMKAIFIFGCDMTLRLRLVDPDGNVFFHSWQCLPDSRDFLRHLIKPFLKVQDTVVQEPQARTYSLEQKPLTLAKNSSGYFEKSNTTMEALRARNQRIHSLYLRNHKIKKSDISQYLIAATMFPGRDDTDGFKACFAYAYGPPRDRMNWVYGGVLETAKRNGKAHIPSLLLTS